MAITSSTANGAIASPQFSESIRRSSKWLRLTKPTSTSPAPNGCTARRSPPRTSCFAKSPQRPSLPCSGGLGATRLVAKVASDQAKPRGLVWVAPGSEAAFLAPLAVRRIPGIGKVTEAALKALGIETVGQLQAIPLERLEETFGRWGTALFRKARGIDSYEFFVDAEPKSISHNQTFGEDTNDRELLESTLSHLCQKAAKRLRDAGLACAHGDPHASLRGFQNHHAQPDARRAFRPRRRISAHHPRAFRSTRGTARRCCAWWASSYPSFSSGAAQLDLLDPGRREKLERLARTTDRLRDRFGFSKVQFGGSLPTRDHARGITVTCPRRVRAYCPIIPPPMSSAPNPSAARQDASLRQRALAISGRA